jgi:hypothetical protein
MTETATRSPIARAPAVLVALVLVLAAPAAAQSPTAATDPIERLPPVVVIDSTPVPALGTPIDKYAGNVQSVPAGDVERQHGSVLDGLWVGAEVVSVSGSYLRGDDGNDQRALPATRS